MPFVWILIWMDMNTSLFRVTLKQLSIYILSAFQKNPPKILSFSIFVLWHAELLYFFLLFCQSFRDWRYWNLVPWVWLHSLLFSNFHLSFGHPFFPLLFTRFILSIYNSLSDPFNYFLPIPLPLLLSLLTFCVRPSPLPRINGLILLLKQMSIRAQWGDRVQYKRYKEALNSQRRGWCPSKQPAVISLLWHFAWRTL